MHVPFNQPFVTSVHIDDKSILRTLGKYYQRSVGFFNQKLGLKNIILTPSCTSALELVALCLDLHEGDEVILPSYTYVSTANAFALRGVKLVFADSLPNHPSIDPEEIEKKITIKTKAIVIVHYAGIVLDHEQLIALKKKYKIPVIEDAAHCLGTTINGKQAGTLGDFSTFSFHETKNISCGQGGCLVVNNNSYFDKCLMIAQCGTDKQAFIDKKVKWYSWKSLGSNYLLAEPLCAILLASLKKLKMVTQKRSAIFQTYHTKLSYLEKEGRIKLPPMIKGGNGHIFYLVTKTKAQRDNLIEYLKKQGIESTFHYYPLHKAEFYNKRKVNKLPNSEKFGDTLVRLPLFYGLTSREQNHVIKSVKSFFEEKN